MTDTSTEAMERLEEAFQKAKRDLRERVVCYVLRAPVTVGDFLDRIDVLAAERDKWYAGWMEAEAKVSELEAERDVLKAELHEARMQAIVDFGKLQEACEERDALRAYLDTLPDGDISEDQVDAICALAYGRTDHPVVLTALQEKTDDSSNNIHF
jgi:hypothetical protein